MKKLIKLFIILLVIFISTKAYAASVSINASSTSCYVGDRVTVSVNIYAGTWNIHVSGSANDSIVGYDMDSNKSTTKTYTIDTSSVGTRTVTITGDITDYDTDVTTTGINKSVTINIYERPATTTQPTTQAPKVVTTKKPTTTTTTTQQGEVKGEEVTTETTTTSVQDYNLKISIVGYEIDFDKGINEYTINVDNSVSQLYVLVEGDIETSLNNIVDIKDKDAFDVVVKHGEEEIKYTFNINRNNNTYTVKNNDNSIVYKILLLISGIIIIVETGILIYVTRCNKKVNVTE